jgi:hypothetical protein
MKKVLKLAMLAAFYILFFGTFVMGLWNWLMPTLFNLPMITFSQALGLFVLLRILTGGFKVSGMASMGGNNDNWEEKKQIFDKWKNMSDQDRDRLRDEWREKCRTRHHKDDDDEPKDLI